MRRYILKPVPLGYANRVYAEQLADVTPISPARYLYETRLLTRPMVKLSVDDMDIVYTTAAYNNNKAMASRINNQQAVDNVNLIVPKVNEESRLGSIDYELE